MVDKTNIQILKEFAKSSNRTIEVKESLYPRNGFRALQKYRRTIYMPYNNQNSSFFVWFNDPYSQIGTKTLFCGAFIPLPSNIKSKLNIRRKIFLDNLNFSSKANNNKIGNDNFDSKMVLSGTIDPGAKRLLSQSRIQHQIYESLKIKDFIFVSINEYKLDFVPELKETPHLSIISYHNWEINGNQIEKVFKRIEKIRELINT